MDCTRQSDDGNSAECNNLKGQYLATTGNAPPCEQKRCKLLDPALFFERISYIPNPEYVCYSDANSIPYEYVEYIVRNEGTPQIGLGLEDNLDGTWSGYYFEYQPDGSEEELPEFFFREDLTLGDVQACRKAFDPPFSCSP